MHGCCMLTCAALRSPGRGCSAVWLSGQSMSDNLAAHTLESTRQDLLLSRSRMGYFGGTLTTHLCAQGVVLVHDSGDLRLMAALHVRDALSQLAPLHTARSFRTPGVAIPIIRCLTDVSQLKILIPLPTRQRRPLCGVPASGLQCRTRSGGKGQPMGRQQPT